MLVRSQLVSFFIDIKSFRSHYGPGVDPASNRNEYQEHFLVVKAAGGKGGRYIRLTNLPPSCAVVMKSGNLNFLEPSGPLQACNGTALRLRHDAQSFFFTKKKSRLFHNCTIFCSNDTFLTNHVVKFQYPPWPAKG